MSNLSPEKLIDNNIRLVSLPEILNQVNQLANEPTASAADIAQTVSQDNALTVRLLKIVNSSFYGFPSRIDSLGMAVSVLGTCQLKDLVMAAGLFKRLQMKTSQEFDTETFWCHSITTGIASRIIAIKLMIANSERFFVTGLLHDIGKLIMHQAMPEKFSILNRELDKNTCDVKNIEIEIFGFTHDELGVAMLKAWNFPDAYYVPIAAHATMRHGGRYEKDAALLHLANNIANNLQAPISRDDDILLNPRALQLLDITPESIEAVYEETYHHLDELLDIFYYQAAT